MKKKNLGLLLMVGALFLVIFLYMSSHEPVKQSLVSFPEDQSLSFPKAETTLSVNKVNTNGKYNVIWNVRSETNKSVYLRQDVSLLFKDGRLMSILNRWEKQEDALEQSKTIQAVGSGHYQAITVHHAESHNQNQEDIKGKEIMSYDHLYVMASSLNRLSSFRTPQNRTETDWYHAFERAHKQQKNSILEETYHEYNLSPTKFHILPLSDLPQYNNKALPNMSLEKTHQVISRLWEGLYKNYILGIKEPPRGKPISPLGSSMPYILLDKNGKVLYVATETNTGHLILLKQNIQD